MKVVCFLAIICLSFFADLSAQETENKTEPESNTKIGVGVSFFDLDYFAIDYLDYFVPKIYTNITFADKIRIEPGIGIYNSLYSSWDKYLDFDIGFMYIGKKENFYFLSGLRPGIIYDSEDYIPQLKLAFAGEYFLSKYFSLGAEAQVKAFYVTYYHSGDQSDYEMIMATGSMLTARFYFK